MILSAYSLLSGLISGTPEVFDGHSIIVLKTDLLLIGFFFRLADKAHDGFSF